MNQPLLPPLEDIHEHKEHPQRSEAPKRGHHLHGTVLEGRVGIFSAFPPLRFLVLLGLLGGGQPVPLRGVGFCFLSFWGRLCLHNFTMDIDIGIDTDINITAVLLDFFVHIGSIFNTVITS